MPAKKVFTVVMIMVLCLLPIKDSIAAPIVVNSFDQDSPPINEIGTGTAPTSDLNRSAISSLSGSKVTFDSNAGGAACYIPASPQTFCFKSESFTTDWERVYNNWMKFPSDWAVSNVYVQGTPVCDGGDWNVIFSWSFQTSPYEINIAQTRYQDPTDHCVATYCVDVTPAGIANEAEVSWFFDGNGNNSVPHNPCSSDVYTPAGQDACDEWINPVAAVPLCGPQVMITPAEIEASGCHGESQSHIMTLTNLTGAETTFDITYDKNFTGDILGPDQITLAYGATTNFDVILDPHICADNGEYIATVTVSDGTHSDQSIIYYEVYSELHEWQQIPTNPSALLDNVLAAYNGKVWSIAGYGTSGLVNTYDPALDTWTVIPGSGTPWGGAGYPRSGCQMDNEVFIYGDASGAYTGLWSYNMDTNTWTQETPGGTPPPYAGIWTPSWVADTDTGLCYMTGGATAPGGGDMATVYVYNVITNTWLPELPVFTSARDWHSAFLFTRPSDSHKLLCVAGGNNSDEMTSTQCYDFSVGTWNAEDTDLGALPVSLWAMGYTQRMTPTGEQLWMVAGAFNSTSTNQSWYYDVNTGAWMDGGLLESGPTYRTAAVTIGDTVYHVGGSVGPLSPSRLSDKLVDIICPACILPAFTKQATEIALPGQIIHYTITVDPMLTEPALITDTLPELVEYVPGSLSVSPDIGSYDYDTLSRMIWWSNGQSSAKTNGLTPAEKSEGSSSTETTTQSEEPTQLVQVTRPENQITSVLWDQPLSSVNQIAFINQEFPDKPVDSFFLADDFEVTVPWLMDTIFVPGNGIGAFTTLFNATALTFMIYEDNAGIPAGDPYGGGLPPVWSYTLPPTDPQITITNGSGGFPSNTKLVLDDPLLLPTGHYWLIFYPTMSVPTGGQFGRQIADTMNLHTARFINPGGGLWYGTEWQWWMPVWGIDPDMAFSIEGMEVPTLQIEFDATVIAPLNQIIWNYAYLQYVDSVLPTSASTFTGYGTYLPITIK